MASRSCPPRSHPHALIVSRSALAGMLVALLYVLGASPAWAQGGPRSPVAPSAESLTQSLVGLAGQSAPLQTLRNAATARKQHLLGLMESDPGAVLRVAIPAAVRAGFPAAIHADVEEEVALDGELQVFHEDYAKSSRYRHFLQTATERLAMHFAKEAPTLLTGTRVRVRGVRLGQDLALNGTGGTVQALTSVAPNTFGAQKTLVILVNFQDNAGQPFSVSEVQGVAFTTTSNHYKENSFQQTWLTGDVAGWFTIAMSTSVCDTATLATLAKQKASAAGYNLSNYTRHVFGFPINACGWWGMGSVGGNPSQAWINGEPFSLKVLGHEMGHNLGLYHSHALECGASAATGSCSSIEYGDTLDIMGNPSSGHFTAYQKERIGWLNYGASPPISTVSTEGLYWIDAYETPGTNPKALKIPKTTSPKTWYYVEYRQALGYDGFLSGNSNVLNGVVIHLGTESSPDSSYLLDLTPQTDSWDDPALLLGQSFTDATAGSGSAGLQVASPMGTADGFYQLTQAATNTAAPTYAGSTQSTYVVASSLNVTVSPGQATYNRNQSVTLTATVTGGTAPVSGASVAFTITKTGGAVTTGTATTNSSGQAVYKFRIGKHDPVGTYSVGVKATLGNVAGAASTSFQVQ